MTKQCKKYGSQQISRFVDKELPGKLYDEMAQHHANCPDCRRLIEKYRSLSMAFNHHADKAILKMDKTTLRQNLELVLENNKQSSWQDKLGYQGKNIYLKLAFIAVILAVSLFMFYGNPFSSPTGPSAIVTSVNSEVASVMIIETQKKNHTIIWFSET